jgi:glycosyltransferase involved in cell wall biosynthesis
VDISVIIPTHDRAHTLERALGSVFGQTHAPAEVLVVDDGSTDDTEGLIRTEYPHCHYVHQDNRGVSHARNQGIRLSRCAWVAFLDSDDEWLPDKLAAQVQALSEHPDHRICHTEEIWIRNGVRVNAMKKHAKNGGHIFRQCLPLCVISPSSVMIQRSLFDEIGLFDESLPACEDYDLWLRICARHPVLFLEKPMIVKHGGHRDQLSRRYWGMDRFRIQALEKIIDTPGLSPGDRIAVAEMLIHKTGILAQGARKRQHTEPALRYQEKWLKYQALRDRLGVAH